MCAKCWLIWLTFYYSYYYDKFAVSFSLSLLLSSRLVLLLLIWWCSTHTQHTLIRSHGQTKWAKEFNRIANNYIYMYRVRLCGHDIYLCVPAGQFGSHRIASTQFWHSHYFLYFCISLFSLLFPFHSIFYFMNLLCLLFGQAAKCLLVSHSPPPPLQRQNNNTW